MLTRKWTLSPREGVPCHLACVRAAVSGALVWEGWRCQRPTIPSRHVHTPIQAAPCTPGRCGRAGGGDIRRALALSELPGNVR